MGESIQGILNSPEVAQNLQFNNPKEQSTESFIESLKDYINRTNQLKKESDQAIQEFSAGQDKNLHEVMISMEKANISLKLLVRMRNEAVDAYQKIMRMQV